MTSVSIDASKLSLASLTDTLYISHTAFSLDVNGMLGVM